MPKHDINKLSLIWDKRQKDFVVKYPRRCDGNLIMNTIINDILKFNAMNRNFYNKFNLKEELEKRGYDLTTLKFEIKLKEND